MRERFMGMVQTTYSGNEEFLDRFYGLARMVKKPLL
jgi:hypothetical protein